MKTWFVIYCKSRKDELAENSLLAKGFDVYRPLLRQVDENNIQSEQKESLFPRYLFIRVDVEEQSLETVKFTTGVIGFVKFGDMYSTVKDSVILDIKACESAQQTGECENNSLIKGEPVYINGKGFTNIKATFFEKCSDNRVIVFLNMLGGMSSVSVPSCSVSRASSC